MSGTSSGRVHAMSTRNRPQALVDSANFDPALAAIDAANPINPLSLQGVKGRKRRSGPASPELQTTKSAAGRKRPRETATESISSLAVATNSISGTQLAHQYGAFPDDLLTKEQIQDAITGDGKLLRFWKPSAPGYIPKTAEEKRKYVVETYMRLINMDSIDPTYRDREGKVQRLLAGHFSEQDLYLCAFEIVDCAADLSEYGTSLTPYSEPAYDAKKGSFIQQRLTKGRNAQLASYHDMSFEVRMQKIWDALDYPLVRYDVLEGKVSLSYTIVNSPQLAIDRKGSGKASNETRRIKKQKMEQENKDLKAQVKALEARLKANDTGVSDSSRHPASLHNESAAAGAQGEIPQNSSAGFPGMAGASSATHHTTSPANQMPTQTFRSSPFMNSGYGHNFNHNGSSAGSKSPNAHPSGVQLQFGGHSQVGQRASRSQNYLPTIDFQPPDGWYGQQQFANQYDTTSTEPNGADTFFGF